MAYCRFNFPADVYGYEDASIGGICLWFRPARKLEFVRFHLDLRRASDLDDNEAKFAEFVDEVNKELRVPMDELTRKTLRRAIRDYVRGCRLEAD